jgi:hypothetical protein
MATYSPAASSRETPLSTVRAPKRFVTPLRLSTVESYSMKRRSLLALGVACGLCAPLARAQPQGKVWRVGLLSARKVPSLDDDPQYRAFFAALRELGYVRGKNLAIEYRSADGDYERLPRLAAELVALEVDLILAAGGRPSPRRKRRPRASRSSWGRRAIRWAAASCAPWRAPAATSPASPMSPPTWASSCSTRF